MIGLALSCVAVIITLFGTNCTLDTKRKNIDIATLKIEIDELERDIGEINLSNSKICKTNWAKWQPHETTSSFD